MRHFKLLVVRYTNHAAIGSLSKFAPILQVMGNFEGTVNIAALPLWFPFFSFIYFASHSCIAARHNRLLGNDTCSLAAFLF